MDNKINYQELIVKSIELSDGLKSRDLALKIMSHLVNPSVFDNENYLSALEGLVEDSVIVQVSYETPINGTITMYFPKGTRFWFEGIH